MRIVKIEVPVYRYAELNDKAKEVVKDHILSATRDAQGFTDSVKHNLDVLGIEKPRFIIVLVIVKEMVFVLPVVLRGIKLLRFFILKRVLLS